VGARFSMAVAACNGVTQSRGRHRRGQDRIRQSDTNGWAPVGDAGSHRLSLGTTVLRAISVIIMLLLPTGAQANEPKKPAVITVTLDPSTVWQPRGGQVRLVLESSQPQALADVRVTARFHWSANDSAVYWPAVVDLIELKGTKATYRVAVPDKDFPALSSSWFDRIGSQLFSSVPPVPGRFDALQTVPLADLRVEVTGPPAAGGTPSISPVDVTLGIGTTSLWNARIWAAVAVLLSIAVLNFWARRRGVPGKGPLLRLISTRRGYASLSQFQIVLWSFLLGAGAIYIMVLSGSLIDIPSRALVLLGIAGGTTVLSKVQSSNADAKTPMPPAPPTAAPGPVGNVLALPPSTTSVSLTWTAPAPNAAATVANYRVDYRVRGTPGWTQVDVPAAITAFQVTGLLPSTIYQFQVFAVNAIGAGPASPMITATTTAAPVPGALPARNPEWSDLVITPSHPGEIDVTRVQMLFFTLISAGFVALQLFNSYMIPDIPDGFLLLMGISNGVYLGAKFVPD
jgi:hypothetical protein